MVKLVVVGQGGEGRTDDSEALQAAQQNHAGPGLCQVWMYDLPMEACMGQARFPGWLSGRGELVPPETSAPDSPMGFGPRGSASTSPELRSCRVM